MKKNIMIIVGMIMMSLMGLSGFAYNTYLGSSSTIFDTVYRVDYSNKCTMINDITCHGYKQYINGSLGVLSLNVSGNPVYYSSGTDVAIADGGTGQSTKTPAFDALAPATTKGDIIVYDGSDNIRLAVGSANQVLKVNGSTGTGLQWATAGGTGTVTSVTCGSGLTGGTITGSGTCAINSSYYKVGGTDVAIADGGTGASNKTNAFNALSPTTTKGDIIVSTGTNNVRIGAGTDGQILISNSSTSSGLQWKTSSAGSAGTVTSVTCGSGLTGGTFTTTGTCAINSSYYKVGGTDVSLADGGTGASNKTNAYNALSPMTTKGDLVSHSGTNGIRLPTGSLGQVLISNTSTSSGLQWKTLSYGSGTVTSVTCGSGLTGGTITGSGTCAINSSYYKVGGTDVAIADGGTGASNKTNAFNALSPTTTKGDIIVSTGTNNIRLAVGTNDYELVGNSSATSGLSFVKPQMYRSGTQARVDRVINATSQTNYIGTLSITFNGTHTRLS